MSVAIDTSEKNFLACIEESLLRETLTSGLKETPTLGFSSTSYMNMPFTDSATSGYWRYAQMRNSKGVLNSKPDPAASTIPDVKGMGLKDAVYLLENMGLKVTASGRGKVIDQSLVAGTNINKAQTISLVLN